MVVISHFKLYPTLFPLKWLICIPNISAVRGNVIFLTLHEFYRTAIKNFPTGHFRLSSWIYTKMRFCKEFSMARWWRRCDRWPQIFIFMLVIRHAELVSASHSEPVLVFHREQMLKRVQHDEMIINMRRGNVGTSACSVRGSLLTQIAPIPPKAYSNISWDSREIITLVFSSDTARNVPTPPTTHHSFLITHYSKCSSVLLSNLTTRNSSLIAHNSPLKIASTVYKTTNLPSDNQKVVLSLGCSERNRYFCINQTNLI